MQKLRNALYLLIGLAIVTLSFYAVLQQPAPVKYQIRTGPTLTIGGKTLSIEIADTEATREQGLSGRTSLPNGSGMLFVFDTPGSYGFWMKDMSFPIDIVWLDEAKQVIDIEKNVLPGTFPHVFYPPRPVKYVVETNPGEL